MNAYRGRPEGADTAKERILKALKRGVCTAIELANPAIGGLRYTARIAELREEGWAIKTQPIDGRSYCEYVLLGRTEDLKDRRQIPLF